MGRRNEGELARGGGPLPLPLAVPRRSLGIHLAPLLALLALLVAASLPGEGIGLPACPLRALTGVPCAGCGLTRSIIRAARGEWGMALRLHPLGPVFCLALLGIAAAGLLPRAKRARLGGRLGHPAVLRTAGIGAVGVLLANEVVRLLWIFGWRQPSLW